MTTTPVRNAAAEALEYAIATYRANDPANSLSGTTEGRMRRQGRRDVCVGLVAIVMRVPEDAAREALENMTRA